MEQEQKKSPVEIIQKLIAIHTTRNEAFEKIIKNNASQVLQEKLKLALSQSEEFIKVLLDELSQFGDAVQSEVDREDEYQEIWNKAGNNIDTMDTSTLSDIVKQSENSLVNIYSKVVDSNQDLPLTLNELLISQVNELKQTL